MLYNLDMSNLSREDRDRLIEVLRQHEDGTASAQGHMLKDAGMDIDDALEILTDTENEFTWIGRVIGILKQDPDLPQ